MTALRALFLRHRAVAIALIALALAMKAIIPAGYMIGGDARALTVQICDGLVHDSAVVIAVKSHGDAGKAASDHQACPFAALGHAGLAATDPVLLALALAFIVLRVVAAARLVAPHRFARLRPPPRAPPFIG